MVNDIIKLLNEAFSSANKRYYQRRQDERIKEMRAAGFDPSDIVDEVNPNSQSLAKAERNFAKFLDDKKKNELNQGRVSKEIEDIDSLFEQYELKDAEAAAAVEAEYQLKAREIGQVKASEWFRSELLKRLDKSIVSGGETWDDELTKDFSNSPITKGDFPDPIGDRRSSMDVSNVPAKPSNSGSNEKVKHLIIAFKKYMNAGREDAGGTNKDAELMAFFDHLIKSGDIDVDEYTLGEAFPNVNREDYSDQQWKVANARAIQRVKNANIPELREILSRIMDRSDDELAELKEDIVIESNSGITIIAAGTKILIENTINESTDITGKLDPLIAKYEKLKAKASEDDELSYDLIVDKLQTTTTLEDFKSFLKIMHSSLTDELKQLNAAKTKATPDSFSMTSYKTRENSFKISVSIYNDIIAYGKSIKLF